MHSNPRYDPDTFEVLIFWLSVFSFCIKLHLHKLFFLFFMHFSNRNKLKNKCYKNILKNLLSLSAISLLIRFHRYKSQLKLINLDEQTKPAVCFLFTKLHVLFQWFDCFGCLEQVFFPGKDQLGLLVCFMTSGAKVVLHLGFGLSEIIIAIHMQGRFNKICYH